MSFERAGMSFIRVSLLCPIKPPNAPAACLRADVVAVNAASRATCCSFSLAVKPACVRDLFASRAYWAVNSSSSLSIAATIALPSLIAGFRSFLNSSPKTDNSAVVLRPATSKSRNACLVATIPCPAPIRAVVAEFNDRLLL